MTEGAREAAARPAIWIPLLPLMLEGGAFELPGM